MLWLGVRKSRLKWRPAKYVPVETPPMSAGLVFSMFAKPIGIIENHKIPQKMARPMTGRRQYPRKRKMETHFTFY